MKNQRFSDGIRRRENDTEGNDFMIPENTDTPLKADCPSAPCSASEYRGTRCPICFWALYDGDWCQGPKWCANRGKSVGKPIRLTNNEAMEMIRHYCPTCGRHVPCRHCEPNAEPIHGEKEA